ncbi:uncharacterized protein, partial [Centruroides vittatus]|uniref:uncharacterized protein n=1 Tax=Centruroides vittatus TaxID=120091 RepID=UPI00350F0EDC
YLTVLSDGDSKTYHKLQENIYGENYIISKEECIYHVSKRMGLALRKLKETSKLTGINLGEPHHTFCLTSVQYWFHFKQALEEPSRKRKHTPTLPKEIGQALLPIYKQLTDQELLKRCTRNKTQNNNESLHSLIWQKCPKINFASLKTISTATSLAIMQFNRGPTAFINTLTKLSIPTGNYHLEAATFTLKRKLSDATRFSSEKAKKDRKDKKNEKIENK